MEPISSNSQVTKYYLTWKGVKAKAKLIAEKINKELPNLHDRPVYSFGIPRGGVYVSLMLDEYDIHPVKKPHLADVFVDDIVHTEKTKTHWQEKYPGKPFYSLYTAEQGQWLVFPWEQMQDETGPTENVRRIITYIGDDFDREGLKETPDRVVKSWNTLYGGYNVDPKSVLKVFEEDSSDEMVVLKNIEFYSTCEHHMLPFFGKAHIAYIPDKKVVGISKLARVLETFARRLQIQERLCQQVTALLDCELKPKGSACILEAQHFCMTSRGVQKQNSIMTTSSLSGVFKTDPRARAELFEVIKI